MELMIVLFLLVLVNLLIAVARQQSKRWIRYGLNMASSLILVVTFLFMIRCMK